MSEFMNEPISYDWKKEDIIQEYKRSGDKKKTARIWGITVKEVNEILRGAET